MPIFKSGFGKRGILLHSMYVADITVQRKGDGGGRIPTASSSTKSGYTKRPPYLLGLRGTLTVVTIAVIVLFGDRPLFGAVSAQSRGCIYTFSVAHDIIKEKTTMVRK